MASHAAELGGWAADSGGGREGRGEPLHVGGRFGVWWFVLPLVLGVLATLLGLLLLAWDKPAWPLFAGAGGLLVIAGAVAGVAIRRARKWVELLAEGFVLTERAGVQEFRDADVRGLAYHAHPHYSSGRPTSATRHLVLWMDAGVRAEPIVLSNRLPRGADDPLAPLVRRLNARLKEQAERALRRQESVEGEGWEWNGSELRFGAPGRWTTLALPEIDAVERIGRELRIWRRGESLPAERLPCSGRNAWLLEALLRERVVPTEGPRGGDDGGHRLGRVLFERRHSPILGWTVQGVGTLLGGSGGACLAAAFAARSLSAALLGLALAFTAGVLLLAGYRMRRIAFRCHARGLCRVGLTGRQELAYDEIDVFSFDARRQRAQGRYTGTLYTLVLADHSRAGAGIFHSETVPHEDPELEHLRERVSEHIARRMARTYARVEWVQWTPELWLYTQGLEYRRRRLWQRTPVPLLIPYDAVTDYEVRDGWFHVWTNFQERAAVKVKTSSPNFYPGLIVFERLVSAHARRPAGERRMAAGALEI